MKLIFIIILVIIICILCLQNTKYKDTFINIKNSLFEKTKNFYDNNINQKWKDVINSDLLNFNKYSNKVSTNLNDNNLASTPALFNLMEKTPITNNDYIAPQGMKDDKYSLQLSDSNYYEYVKELPKKYDYLKFKNNNIPNTINDDNSTYNYYGVAYNEFYNQYYLLYETEFNENTNTKQSEKPYINNDLQFNTVNVDPDVVDSKNSEYLLSKLYKYLLVKVNQKNNTTEIIHKVAPRSKININDIIYFSYGEFQIGPLVIKQTM